MATEWTKDMSQADALAPAAVAQEISHYLETHPNASDTLEGVVKWWLARQRYEYAFRTVEKALEYLVEQGKVAKQATVGGKTLYSSVLISSRRH